MNDPIDGPYRVQAVDIWESATIYYDVGDGGPTRIPDGVYAYGWNSDYIVAAVHPRGHADVNEYYYIIRSVDGPTVTTLVSVKGPLTRQDFDLATKSLYLPQLTHQVPP